jgi:hypothetical protein
MWERVNKVKAQVIACMVIIIGCFMLAILAAFNIIPPGSQAFIASIVSPMLMGALGWLFTMNKSNTSSK